MSDPTSSDPRHGPADAPGTHPDELLAGYVDGSASASERIEVERHLATCEQCAAELGFARSARTALRSLPEFGAPGLAGRGLAGLRPTGAAPVIPISKAPRVVRWDRVAWGAGLAAAASLVVVFALSALHGGTTRGTSVAGPIAGKAPGSGAEGLPGIVNNGTDYTPQSLASLATRLIQTSFAAVRGPTLAPGSPADVPSPSVILSCLQQGSGLDASAGTRYLEVADYQGAPVYIGAFVTQPPAGSGARSHLLLAVVTRDGCRPITVIRQPL